MAITTKLSLAAVLLIAVLTFFSAVDAGRASRGVSWADWSRRDGVPVHVKQLEQLSDADSDEEYYRKGIRFELYTIQNPEEPELMDIYSSEIPETTLFDPRRPTKVAVHGWQSNSHGLIQLRSAFLAVGDVNFISVNWADIDTIVYPLSSYHVPLIGQRVAYLLDFLRLMYGVPLSSVHVIGHSLGAHISGLAGSMTEWGKVGRITGLDPAGPLFPRDPTRRLDKNDGVFVDVIHTCANVLGYKDAIGHVDFYPNGGTCFQPGCALLDLTRGTCSHNRAIDFMEESIRGGVFTAYPCKGTSTVPDFDRADESIVMGLNTPITSNGSYCLTTNNASPFALDPNKQKKVTAVHISGPDDQFKSRVYRTFMRRGVDSQMI